MNPWPVVIADLRALRWIAWAAPLVIALAVSVGIAVSAQEAALRHASAQAADDFDLLIGAPGSPTQLVLTSVYLQAEALPLIDGSILNRLAADVRVKAAAPIAFGDVVRGYPVVGTTPAFAGRWGKLSPELGRLFAAKGEAVIGAEVDLALGDAVTPSHAVTGHRSPFGVEAPEEATHRHAGIVYRVVGRLPRLGSPWDRAILVPIESVWETHGLGSGHKNDGAALGAPYDAETVPGVPAIVVKPASVADAYTLRGVYRQGLTTALFPAEVLVTLYRTLGDVRDVLVVASLINDGLIFAAMTMLLVALAGLRRRRYAMLRALGASRGYLLLTVWLSGAVILAAGCVGALAVGGLASTVVASLIEARTGLHLAVRIEIADFIVVAGLIAVASVMALGPAVAALRIPVAQILRGS